MPRRKGTRPFKAAKGFVAPPVPVLPVPGTRPLPAVGGAPIEVPAGYPWGLLLPGPPPAGYP